jgi:hypothetical protein
MWPKWKVLRKIWKPRAEARRPENRDISTSETDFPEEKMIPARVTDLAEELCEVVDLISEPDGKKVPGITGGDLGRDLHDELARLAELMLASREPDPWSMMKWRPLVSFAGHYLKKLLGLLGKFSVFSLRVLGIVLGCVRPERFWSGSMTSMPG